MNLIQIQDGHKAYGPRVLFEDATFAINSGEKVGVIGPNGAGKSTLFKILTGKESLDQGQVIRSSALRLGYLAQEVSWEQEETLSDYLSNCTTPLWKLKQHAVELGLKPHHFEVPILTLSGGYRMRCKLLYLLGFEPNLMLLDEPTNYLDLETLLVLESFLNNYDGSFLVISHDREFLKRTTQYTLEVESQDINKFSGNIEAYFEQKALLEEQQRRTALSIAAKRKAILDFAARFGASATKASQVQSRLKSLKKLDPIETRALPVRAHILIPEPPRISRQVIELKDADLGYSERTILTSVNLRLERGDKLGVVGYNGVGKSTLLKSLAGALPLLKGGRTLGAKASIGYYAQHVSEALDPSQTVFEALATAAHPEITHQEVLNMGGSLLFSGNAIHKSISLLSGGERARVALGQIFLKKVSVLLLDEVTNHLDFETVEALTQALSNYQGTVVIISHDRGFVRRVATSILEINRGKVSTYPGTYDEYVWSVENREHTTEDEDKSTDPTPLLRGSSEKKKPAKGNLKHLQKESSSIEKTIRTTQKRIEEINALLLNSENQSTHAGLLEELSSLPNKITDLEDRWLLLQEEMEALQK